MKKLGMIIPSSNTTVEHLTMRMIAQVKDISAHFSRFRATEISLDPEIRKGFGIEKLLNTAIMLADADVDVIAYNATSGGWLGFDRDRELCERITALTAIPATTTVLALLEVFRLYDIRKFCMVAASSGAITEKAVEQYHKHGFECTGYRSFGVSINKESSAITETQIYSAVKEVYAPGADAILLSGTNMPGAHLVEALEEQYGVPVLDTVSVTLWHSLRLSGESEVKFEGWGRLLRD